jgi:hypothetical protein
MFLSQQALEDRRNYLGLLMAALAAAVVFDGYETQAGLLDCRVGI